MTRIALNTVKMVALLLLAPLFGVTVGSSQTVLPVIMQLGDDAKRLHRGTGIIGMNDVNNDGWPDLAVGVNALRQTYIYFGGPGILDTTADVRLRGAGTMVKGDINGDGNMDYVLSNYDTVNDTLYVYLGKAPSPLKLDTVPSYKIDPEGPLDDFGESGDRGGIAIGDVNRDGLADLVVGAQRWGLDQGKTYIFLGKESSPLTPDLVASGEGTEELFGFCIGVGDINGDGYDDLAISSNNRRTAPTIDIWYTGPGFVFQRNNYAQRFTFDTYSPAVNFTLVDFNADGKADLSYSDGYRTYFHFGSADSLSATPSFVVIPESTFYSYHPRGGAIGVGDLNGDGKEDFVIRQAPRGYSFMCINVYLGNQPPSPDYVSGRCKASVDEFTAFREVVPVGDINGDGVNDFAGAVPYDNQVQYLQDGYVVIFSGSHKWVTNIPGRDGSCPCEFELSQNYPNPFNPATTITYRLPTSGMVRLAVFDLLGREAAVLVNERRDAGSHEVNFDGSRFASGVYFYTLTFNWREMQSRRLLILR